MTVVGTEFESACRVAVDDLRAALIDLYSSVGADPANPQEAARRFRVNKTLTWTISRIVSAGDPVSAIATIPGAHSLRSLVSAMEREGAGADRVARLWKAVEQVDETVATHAGDRSTLQLIVDGIEPMRGDHLEASRRLAFRGNSGMWGVQARVRVMTAFLAPNADESDRVDSALVRGLIGLRRLRSVLRWPIFHLRSWGVGVPESVVHPFEAPPPGAQASPLLRRFSTLAPSDIEESRAETGATYTLVSGPIGNTGAVDCYIADYERAAVPRYVTPTEATGELGATISVPCEALVLDLIVHESLVFALTPQVTASSGLFGTHGPGEDDPLELPIPSKVARLPGRPPAVALPAIPNYTNVVSFVFETMGWRPQEFEGRRFELSYPPLGSTVLLKFPLGARP